MLCNLSKSFIVIIRNDLCIKLLKHFHHILTLPSPELVKLDAFKMINIPQMLRLNCFFCDNFVSRAPILVTFSLL